MAAPARSLKDFVCSAPKDASENYKTNAVKYRVPSACGFSVNHGFLLTFNMVAYLTKAGLGPEPEFTLLCRSVVSSTSFGGRVLFHGATPICTACTVYSFGGGVGIVLLADSRRQVLPGLFQLRQGVRTC